MRKKADSALAFVLCAQLGPKLVTVEPVLPDVVAHLTCISLLTGTSGLRQGVARAGVSNAGGERQAGGSDAAYHDQLQHNRWVFRTLRAGLPLTSILGQSAAP